MASMTIEIRVKDLAEFTKFAMAVENFGMAANDVMDSFLAKDFSELTMLHAKFHESKSNMIHAIENLLK
jgi:hypothetical protein